MYVDYKALGKRIAARRKELGLKQSDVNEAAGLSDKYLSNIERATSIPSVDVLMRICDALSTTPDRLLLGTVRTETDIKKSFISKADMMTPTQINLAIGFIEFMIERDLGN